MSQNKENKYEIEDESSFLPDIDLSSIKQVDKSANIGNSDPNEQTKNVLDSTSTSYVHLSSQDKSMHEEFAKTVQITSSRLGALQSALNYLKDFNLNLKNSIIHLEAYEADNSAKCRIDKKRND